MAAIAGKLVQELQAYEDADLAELPKDQLKLGVIERNKIIKELKAMQPAWEV